MEEIQATCSAELKVKTYRMTKEDFIKTAVEISKEIGLTEEQAKAIAELTLILESKNL